MIVSPTVFKQKAGRLKGDWHHYMDSVLVVSQVLTEIFKEIVLARSLFECFPIVAHNICGTIKHGRMGKKRFRSCLYMAKLWSRRVFSLFQS